MQNKPSQLTSKIFTYGACLLSLLTVVACSTNTQVSAPEFTPAPPVAQYKIGVGDDLSINVWRNDELSIDIPVRPDGNISVPLAGDIKAAGETPTALAEMITKKLNQYLKNPQVTVMVTNPSSLDFQRRVRVTGAVETPISIAFREGMTVLDLILLANGPNEFASLSNAKLYRKGAQGVATYNINLDDLLNKGKLEGNYELQPSDVLSVPERLF
ncbi:XrtA/PEP-CTERM system exopolysaccharide export protein [Marinibactrum halimedae]|uniref:Sugar ABC transporter substrate-binding protein n=1 Tax=Marinibactrum halimedae TaxID=1444977 RepID=A0AA37T860_9GAMM|nr:XrtA/PEP-CTERM system exopolysaccharide export protein [Marinibactrum halimedae]MCD9459766.1 polysaccharide biosynthesis/export family protein [Marinibactrum halimedae]GLS24477.1 hypothetical protein GCM10007877_01890 [Marinibactrum halimedae]